MTTIRAQCPDCGDVQLPIHQLSVRVYEVEGPGSYSFSCPTCAQPVSREASARIVGLLVGAGAPHTAWHWPAELAEPRVGPAISPDDLLDFHVLLQDEHWFDVLSASVPRDSRG